MSRQSTKRARFAAIAKIRRQNRTAARQASVDLIVFGTCCTYTDGDRLRRLDPRALNFDGLPSGAHVQTETLDDRGQRRITSIWWDELTRLNRPR